MRLDEVDRVILDLLSDKWISTYEIHKKTEIGSWATVYAHCYKLLSLGLIEKKEVNIRFQKKKLMWRVGSE